MSTAYYPSPSDAEVILVEFVKSDGGIRSLKLLVDSGFTGRSSVLLGSDARDLLRAEMPPTEAAGAIRGTQDRGWVTCRVPELNSFQCTLIAILTDVSPLSLPADVQGMVGLSFLRHFARWGSEKAAGGWRFFLSDTL